MTCSRIEGSAQIIWPGQPWSLSIEPDAELAHWIVFAPRAKAIHLHRTHQPLAKRGQYDPIKAPLTGAVKVLAPGQGWTTKTSFVTLVNGAVSAPCSVNFVIDYERRVNHWRESEHG